MLRCFIFPRARISVNKNVAGRALPNSFLCWNHVNRFPQVWIRTNFTALDAMTLWNSITTINNNTTNHIDNASTSTFSILPSLVDSSRCCSSASESDNPVSSTTSPAIEQVLAILHGETVTVSDPRSGATTTAQLSPGLPAGFQEAMVAAGREILLQTKCRNWERMKEAEISNELEQFTDERECVRAVADGLIRLHSKLNDAFAKANINHFGSFASWTRTPEVTASLLSFASFLTEKFFNNNSQSVLEILNPLLDIAALQTVADVALTTTLINRKNVTGFASFADNMLNAGCFTAMSTYTGRVFCRRLVAVPALQKCGFVDASSVSTSGCIGELKSERLNNVVGSSGSGKTLNSMLHAASWDPQAPGVTLLLDIQEDIFPQFFFLNDDEPIKEGVQDMLKRLSDGGPSQKKVRDAICSAYFANAVARALGSSARVDIPNENDLFDVDMNNFLTDNFTNSFTRLRIGKKFRGRVVIVVDEIGSFPWFHRGLRSVWNAVRMFLKVQLHLESEDQLFLITAGSGSENMIELGIGSREETYSIFTVDTPKFFADSLNELAQSGGPTNNNNVKRWGTTILKFLYNKLSTTEIQERAEARKARRSGTNTTTTQVDNSFETESEWVLKQTKLDSRAFYFARIVTYNSRCAALALKLIINAAVTDERLHSDGNMERGIRRSFQSQCSEWTTKITQEFRSLNSLSRLSIPECYDAFARAIRVVMLHQSSLPEGKTTAYCVVYGLLEDRARIVSDFDPVKHALIKNIGSENYLVITKGIPRYHISETFVVMFLRHIGACGAGFGVNNFADANDMFKLATADHHALVASLGFSNCPVPAGIAFTPLQEPSNTLAATEHKPLEGISYRNVERFYCDEHKKVGGRSWLSPTHPEQAVWDKWRRIISDKGCVVIVNGHEAPFADVIVLTPGRVFLTQCKNYDSASAVDVKKEFTKMLTCAEPQSNGFTNEQLREKLAACCQVDDKVEFIATIVVLSAEANVGTPDGPPASRQVNGITWSFVQNPTVFVLDEKQNKSIYSSFLYPVLCTRIQNKPLVDKNDDDEIDEDENNH